MVESQGKMLQALKTQHKEAGQWLKLIRMCHLKSSSDSVQKVVSLVQHLPSRSIKKWSYLAVIWAISNRTYIYKYGVHIVFFTMFV